MLVYLFLPRNARGRTVECWDEAARCVRGVCVVYWVVRGFRGRDETGLM